MISPADINAATANPANVDIPALERAFVAFVAYPGGEGLIGFDGPHHMLTAFTDGVCFHLAGDANSLPNATYEMLLAHAARYGAFLMSSTYRDGASLAVANWQGFKDSFAA